MIDQQRSRVCEIWRHISKSWRHTRFTRPFLYLCFIGVLAVFSTAKYLRFFEQAGDAASYVGLVSSAKDNLTFNPYLYSSILQMNESAWNGVDFWCKSNLEFFVPSNSSVLQWHAYLIAYPLGILSKISGISPALIVSIAEAAAIMLALLMSAKALFKVHRNAVLVGAVLLVVVSSPVLSIGASAQLQPEKLFFLPIVAFFLFAEKYLNSIKVPPLSVGLVYFFGSLISERSAFTLFWVTFAYFVLRKPKLFLRPFTNPFLFGAVLSLSWWLIWTLAIENSFFYDNVDLASILNGLQRSFTTDIKTTGKMIVVLLPLILLSALRWQGLLVGLLSVIPNLAVSVGGAEKTGYATHYHAIYIGVLFGTAIIGSLRLLSKIENTTESRKGWNRSVLVGGLTSAFVLLNLVYSTESVYNLKNTTTNLSQIRRGFGFYSQSEFDTALEKRKLALVEVAGIPIGSKISAPEWVMPALIDQGHQMISYYPLGVADADVVFAESSSGEVSFFPWLMEEQQSRDIGLCIDQVIKNKKVSFDVESFRTGVLRIWFNSGANS